MPQGARDGSPIKKGDAVFVKKSNSCMWLNVLDVMEDKVVGESCYFDKPVTVDKECIIDLFNEECFNEKIEEIFDKKQN